MIFSRYGFAPLFSTIAKSKALVGLSFSYAIVDNKLRFHSKSKLSSSLSQPFKICRGKQCFSRPLHAILTTMQYFPFWVDRTITASPFECCDKCGKPFQFSDDNRSENFSKTRKLTTVRVPSDVTVKRTSFDTSIDDVD